MRVVSSIFKFFDARGGVGRLECGKCLLVAAIAALAGLMLSCMSVKPGFIADDKAATAKAVEQFHARLNAGEFSQVYDDAHNSFRHSQPRGNLIKAIQETRNRLGQFKSVTSSDLNVIVGAPVQVRAAYKSVFEKSAVTELFIFVKQDDRIELSEYRVYPATSN